MEKKSEKINEILYSIGPSTNGGSGMFASKKISRGDLIVAEKPLFIINQSVPSITIVNEKVSKLSPEEKIKFFSLYDCYTPESPTSLGITRTNCLPLGSDSDKGGLFPIISRINHSCYPNVHHFWSEKDKLEKIYALKTIEPGQEILTSYIDLYADRETRQKRLKDSFRFDCKCSLCSNKDVEYLKLSDMRRKRLFELDKDLPFISAFQPELGLLNANEILKLLKEEDLDYEASYVGRVCYDIFSILFQTSRQSLPFWAKMVVDNYMACQGEFSGRLKDQISYYYNK